MDALNGTNNPPFPPKRFLPLVHLQTSLDPSAAAPLKVYLIQAPPIQKVLFAESFAT